MGRGRKPPVLKLTDEDRERLRGWSGRRQTAQGLKLRSRMVVRAAEGRSAAGIAAELKVCVATVRKWWRRFNQAGVAGLLDEPRPGQPRKITDAAIERVLTLTLESRPSATTHWSTRTMAEAAGINQTAVSRIRRAFSLAPHRPETFKLSKDPLFIDKLRDIVGLYLNPPEHALGSVCGRKEPDTGARPHGPAAVHETGADRAPHPRLCAKRHPQPVCRARHQNRQNRWTEPATPSFRRVPQLPRYHREEGARRTGHSPHHGQLWNAQNQVDSKLAGQAPSLPCPLHVHLGLMAEPVEPWFALLTQHQLRGGVHSSPKELKAAIDTFIQIDNKDPKPFVWHKTADQILDLVARFRKRANDSDR
jgi:transposase